MEKIEMINKTRRFLIIIIVIILIFTTSMILLATLWKSSKPKMYTSFYSSREAWKYPCLQEGEVCSDDDIQRAIKVKIKVNENESHDFYLISNDEETATLIMDSNLQNGIDWHDEKVNIKGPVSSLMKLAELTKDWEFIPYIENYEYQDEGLTFFQEMCKDGPVEDEKVFYDCTDNLIPTRGYNGLKIENGIATIHYNIPTDSNDEYLISEEITLSNNPLRVRMIEQKEVDKLMTPDGLPDWMIDHLTTDGGYWTMSSSTFPTSGYMQAAFGVVNENNEASLIELYTLNKQNQNYINNGIRPVITLSKEIITML